MAKNIEVCIENSNRMSRYLMRKNKKLYEDILKDCDQIEKIHKPHNDATKILIGVDLPQKAIFTGRKYSINEFNGIVSIGEAKVYFLDDLYKK